MDRSWATCSVKPRCSCSLRQPPPASRGALRVPLRVPCTTGCEEHVRDALSLCKPPGTVDTGCPGPGLRARGPDYTLLGTFRLAKNLNKHEERRCGAERGHRQEQRPAGPTPERASVRGNNPTVRASRPHPPILLCVWLLLQLSSAEPAVRHFLLRSHFPQDFPSLYLR